MKTTQYQVVGYGDHHRPEYYQHFGSFNYLSNAEKFKKELEEQFKNNLYKTYLEILQTIAIDEEINFLKG